MKFEDYKSIQGMTEDQAKEIATEHLSIKGHDVYLIDFGGYYKFSAAVFFEGNHFYYADDFELHHPGKTHEELRELYIKTMNGKLFTESEIIGPVKDYKDYCAKGDYIRNHYAMQHGHVSMFRIMHNEAEETAFRKKVRGMVANRYVFAYYPDREFSDKLTQLCETLEDRRAEKDNDFDYYKSAFLYEMHNHEYAINWQADFDTLSAFGNLEYVSGSSVGYDVALENYFDQLRFTDVQRRAYHAAWHQYWKEQEEAC